MPLSRIHTHRHASEAMAAASEQPPRPRTADPVSRYSFLGTRRSFPLVMRRKTKDGNGNQNNHSNDSSTALDRPSTSHLLLSTGASPLARTPSLRVRLFLRFGNPLDSEHHAEFQSSPSFEPTDRICQALLRRLQHCSAELITRRDCHAMDPPHAQGGQGSQPPPDDAAAATGPASPSALARPLRFQMTFAVERHGLRWAEETFTSYQRDPVTADLADDILAETRLFVSLFLSRHDPGFPHSSSAEAADPPAVRPETRRPCFGLAQSVCCVPQNQDAQSPGYLIELFLRSRDQGPGAAQRSTSLRLDSQQSSPLTLLLGEDVLSRASRVLDRAFGDHKARFEEQHLSCDGLEGTGGCEHIADGAFDALVKIRNNLGPDYNHLSHRLQSCRILFAQQDSQDFDDFVSNLKEKLGAVRDSADQALNAVDDLSFHVRKLELHDYSVRGPLYVSLDTSITHDRRTTAALLDRVQAGICRRLEGTGASVVLTAHKRGHLVLDACLRDADEPNGTMFDKPRPTVDDLLTRLKDQIRADIVMLCKDTCSLDPSDLLQNLRIYDARSAAYNDRPSTSGPMLPVEPPSTPTGLSLSKRKGRFNLRQFSLSAYEGSPSPAVDADSIPAHGYMSLAPSYDAYLSDSSSTPSLVDTDSISPHDSVLITPESSRVTQRELPAFGIRLMDDELAGAPISTQELGSHPDHPDLHDEGEAIYERSPFQNPFTLSKASSNLSTSPGDSATVVLSSPEPTPVLEAEEPPTSAEQTVQEQCTVPNSVVDPVLGESAALAEEGIDSNRSGPPKEAAVLEGPSTNHSDTASEGMEQSVVVEPVSSDEAISNIPADSSFAPIEAPPSAPSEASKDAVEPEPEPEPELARQEEANSVTGPVPTIDRPAETAGKCLAMPVEMPREAGNPENNTQEEPDRMAEHVPTMDILQRPSLQNLNERPKSSALILRTRPGSSHLDYLPSIGPSLGPSREKQLQRRWSTARPSFLHRRQFSSPTAGFLGLHEEFLIEVGLMNAVIPSHLRSMRS